MIQIQDPDPDPKFLIFNLRFPDPKLLISDPEHWYKICIWIFSDPIRIRNVKGTDSIRTVCQIQIRSDLELFAGSESAFQISDLEIDWRHCLQ